MKKSMEIQSLAAGVLKAILTSSAEDDVTFRSMLTTQSGGTNMPVLLVGKTHREFDDGYCIAILNPDTDLSKDLVPGVAYSRAMLKEIVAKRCDAMLMIWRVAGRVQEVGRYQARRLRPANSAVH